MSIHKITTDKLTFRKVYEIIQDNKKLELSQEVTGLILKCRNYLDKKMETQKEPIYGVSTGFGSLCNVNISKEELSTLQENIVMSHACGMGEEVPQEIVKIMLLFKIQSLSYGHSGVQVETVQRLIDMFNNDILPVVYQQGSLGASGDLAPLSHVALPIIGKGEVNYKGEKRQTEDLYKEIGWKAVTLKSKEGLALLNGTQFMSSFGVFCLMKSFRLSQLADMIAAVSLDAFDGRIEPFYHGVHAIRNHSGQMQTAERFRELLDGSEIINRKKQHVQDPYSFRCVPQVHGASKDSINYVASVFSNEINAVTDNPTIFPDEDLIISAGNFHGQPIAMAMDYLALAMAELGNISERRTYQLIAGKRELPSFLVAEPGLNSGFMIPQYAAASIVSQNKQLCTPASADSIESSQGQEDHVSMGANAATKLLRVVENLEKILGIELFNASQALEFRRPLKSSPIIEEFIRQYRSIVPFVENDKIMYTEMAKSADFLKDIEIPFKDYLKEEL
ncbi:MAG: histidine ammonia-lyase [Hyphomicrobiales bacterium]